MIKATVLHRASQELHQHTTDQPANQNNKPTTDEHVSLYMQRESGKHPSVLHDFMKMRKLSYLIKNTANRLLNMQQGKSQACRYWVILKAFSRNLLQYASIH